MTAAGTALARLQQDFAAWLVTGSDAAAGRLGGGAGLAVYQNNYRVALMTSLEASYARVHAWLGDEAFAAACVHHIDDHPPGGWTLDAYGENFAATLEALYPDDPEVADIARIDWAVGQAFVARDADPMAAEALATIDWDGARITLVPSLRRLFLHSNADALWLALANQDQPPEPETAPAPIGVFVWRQGFESVMRRTSPVEERIARLSQQGLSFAECCADLAADHGEAVAVEQAGQVLGCWIGEGIVAGLG